VLSPRDALKFVEEHGVVLASAKGDVPRLTEAIVGAPIKGSWWSHPQGRAIFGVLNAVADSPDVLACRMIDGKVTLVHRRLWPSLVRIADRFTPAQIAKVHDEHTPSGRHARREVAFPAWVPADVAVKAKAIDEEEALAAFEPWVHR
jgi:hypothetical protein